MGFFILVMGGALVFLFGLSDAADDPRYNLFFWGLMLVVAGLATMRRHRPPPSGPSQRFRWIKSLLQKRKKSG